MGNCISSAPSVFFLLQFSFLKCSFERNKKCKCSFTRALKLFFFNLKGCSIRKTAREQSSQLDIKKQRGKSSKNFQNDIENTFSNFKHKLISYLQNTTIQFRILSTAQNIQFTQARQSVSFEVSITMGNSLSDVSIGDYFIGTRHETIGNHKKLKVVITKGGKLISERIVTGGGSVSNKLRMVSYKVQEVLRNLSKTCTKTAILNRFQIIEKELDSKEEQQQIHEMLQSRIGSQWRFPQGSEIKFQQKNSC